MPKTKEKPTPRTMRVVRRWHNDTFTYYRVYSDGIEEVCTRRDADKYERAFGEKVHTVAV